MDGDKLARKKGFVTLLTAGDLFKDISNTNLIVECGEFIFAVR